MNITVLYLCFIPLLVAVDAIGILPLFLGLTEGYNQRDVNRIIIESVITATTVGLLFLVVGRAVLNLLGVTIPDFMVAGGLLLFIIAIKDVIGGETHDHLHNMESVGAVPLGVPLITGPAVLTTLILLQDRYGMFPTAIAFITNMLIAGLSFKFAKKVYGFLGKAGTRTASKIASILLGAVAVMMVRKGLAVFISNQMN
jgi:multiple antibiotic resistance protein